MSQLSFYRFASTPPLFFVYLSVHHQAPDFSIILSIDNPPFPIFFSLSSCDIPRRVWSSSPLSLKDGDTPCKQTGGFWFFAAPPPYLTSQSGCCAIFAVFLIFSWPPSQRSVCLSVSLSLQNFLSKHSLFRFFFFHLSTLSPVSRFSVVRAGFRIYSRSEHSNRTRVETLDTKTNPFPPGLQWLWGHHRFPEQPSSTSLSKKSFFLFVPVYSCVVHTTTFPTCSSKLFRQEYTDTVSRTRRWLDHPSTHPLLHSLAHTHSISVFTPFVAFNVSPSLHLSNPKRAGFTELDPTLPLSRSPFTLNTRYSPSPNILIVPSPSPRFLLACI